MNKRNAIVTAIVAASALSGIGWIAVANANTDKAAEVAKVTIAHDQAVKIALQAVPGSVVESEFESENGVSLWEIAILGANQQVTEIEVDANTGKILSQKIDNDKDDEDSKDVRDDKADEGPDEEKIETKG
ncbi:MAG: hypothetical protein ACI9UN_005460 [Granulosicoccus sp.]|jgi:hypothetical protein